MTFVSKEKEYILLIGQGLSSFGRMEMALGRLFVVAMRAADTKTAERVFWAVNSLEVRTAMVNAALKQIWPLFADDEEPVACWAEIALDIPKQSRRRAELAHGNWVGIAWIGRKGEQKVDQFFAPYYGKASVDLEFDHTKPGFDPRPAKRLYEKDLEQLSQAFNILEFRIERLRSHLDYWLQQPETKRAQARLHPSRRVRPSATRKK